MIRMVKKIWTWEKTVDLGESLMGLWMSTIALRQFPGDPFVSVVAMTLALTLFRIGDTRRRQRKEIDELERKLKALEEDLKCESMR